MVKIKIGKAIGDKKEESHLSPDEPKLTMKMKARKMLDGSIMVDDHPAVTIILMPSKMKVVVFAKEELNDETYDTQSRFFDFLAKKGIATLDNVQAGNVHGAMEMTYPESTLGAKASDVVLFTIGKFIEDEKPYFMYTQQLEKEEEERLLKPDSEDSTELGEIPQKEIAGTLPTGKRKTYPMGTMGGFGG